MKLRLALILTLLLLASPANAMRKGDRGTDVSDRVRQDVQDKGWLPGHPITAATLLDQLSNGTVLRKGEVSFEAQSPDGEVVYASNPADALAGLWEDKKGKPHVIPGRLADEVDGVMALALYDNGWKVHGITLSTLLDEVDDLTQIKKLSDTSYEATLPSGETGYSDQPAYALAAAWIQKYGSNKSKTYKFQ